MRDMETTRNTTRKPIRYARGQRPVNLTAQVARTQRKYGTYRIAIVK